MFYRDTDDACQLSSIHRLSAPECGPSHEHSRSSLILNTVLSHLEAVLSHPDAVQPSHPDAVLLSHPDAVLLSHPDVVLLSYPDAVLLHLSHLNTFYLQQVKDLVTRLMTVIFNQHIQGRALPCVGHTAASCNMQQQTSSRTLQSKSFLSYCRFSAPVRMGYQQPCTSSRNFSNNTVQVLNNVFVASALHLSIKSKPVPPALILTI